MASWGEGQRASQKAGGLKENVAELIIGLGGKRQPCGSLALLALEFSNIC